MYKIKKMLNVQLKNQEEKKRRVVFRNRLLRFYSPSRLRY
jgi:hypothetical protein